jgi:hypothetical protein
MQLSVSSAVSVIRILISDRVIFIGCAEWNLLHCKLIVASPDEGHGVHLEFENVKSCINFWS